MEQPRRQFLLPSEEREHLDARGLPWETIMDGGQMWLLVHDFPIPSGYNVTQASLALLLVPQYEAAGIDMVYFYPSLQRLDGVGINNLSLQIIEGKEFQRWSRHRSGEAPWREGVDGIHTHLSLVEEWLLREFKRGVA
jgi:hypothetical protein